MLYSFTWKLRKNLNVLKQAKQVKILVHEFFPNILKTSDGEKKAIFIFVIQMPGIKDLLPTCYVTLAKSRTSLRLSFLCDWRP